MNQTVIEGLQWRYATKKFDPTRKLPEAKLDILKEAFNLTATSYGLQPLKLLVIEDDRVKEKLHPASMNQQQVLQASHILVFCIEDKIDTPYIKDYFTRVEKTRNTSREILSDFENYLIQSFSGKSREEVREWMTRQAYLAMGNLLTVCALEGIDSCPMEGFVPAEYDRVLGLEEKGLHAVLVMPVGYRAQDDLLSGLKKVRKGVDEVVIELQG